MTSPAPTARPPGAAIAWVADGDLFIEYPTKSGVPYIVRQHRTAAGLALALGVLMENPDPSPRATAASNPSLVGHPNVTKAYRQSPAAAAASAETRAKALEVLRKLGLKP